VIWFLAVVAAARGSAGAGATEPKLDRHEFAQVHMGMPFKLVLYAPDAEAANRAAEAAFARIAELDALLSDYKPESELSRLSDTAGSGRAVPVGKDLWAVLERAQQLAVATDGAFDVTVGPYVRLWRRSRRQKELPSAERLSEARSAVGYEKLRLDPAARTATLVAPGMRLDLGGIAVGYAIDETMRLLGKHGIKSALIDASGDILVSAPPPGERGWRIGVAPLEPEGPPSRYVELANAAISTAGDAWQAVEIGGVRYSHIVDPKTGMGLTERSGVTVIARDGITADSLDTAVCVLGPERGMKLVSATPGAEALFVRLVAGKVETVVSPGFGCFEVKGGKVKPK
jgi:thiamine biosynthesis lipoprotein